MQHVKYMNFMIIHSTRIGHNSANSVSKRNNKKSSIDHLYISFLCLHIGLDKMTSQNTAAIDKYKYIIIV